MYFFIYIFLFNGCDDMDFVEKNVCTHTTNRGATHTCKTSFNLSCDWVSVTSSYVRDYVSLLTILNLDFDLFSKCENSRNGFREMYIYNGITLLVGHKDRHFMLDISGSGCRFLESLSYYTWPDIFNIFLMYKLNFTRLDLALDAFNLHTFNLVTMYNKVKRGHVKGKFRRMCNIEDISFSDGKELGRTLYFGSPRSKVMFRFYDKKEESLSKKKMVCEDINTWLRFEVQFRDTHAVAIVYNVVLGGSNDMGKYFCGFLRSNLEFLVPSKDTNKWRWATCKWWLDFLGQVEKIPLNLCYKEPTLIRKISWLEYSVSRSNALVNLASSFGVNNPLNNVIGLEKLLYSKKDLCIFNDFLEKCGYNSITLEDFNDLINKKIADYNKDNQL